MTITFLPTNPLYLADDQMLRSTALVLQIGKDEIKKREYHWVLLDRTIFHPQGGGQLSDKGTLSGIPVEYVHKVDCVGKSHEFAILHCFSTQPDVKVGQTVELIVDPITRHEYSRWHTAAHVVGHVVEKIWPHLRPFGGQCFPGDAYMKFKAGSPESLEISLKSEDFDRECRAFCEARPPLVIREEADGTRKLYIGSHEGVGCGGTHLHDLAELGQISITPSKPDRKAGTLTIKYRLSP